MRCRLASALLAPWLLAGAPAAAQEASEEDPLALLGDEFFEQASTFFQSQTIEGVSKHAEALTETPATVTILSREEIERFGFRTLGDVLNFASLGNASLDDRRYRLAGGRGLFFFEDFNTRLLVMLNGHTLNEPWASFAGIGREMLVPMDLVERIEIVYGPSSLLYGGYSLYGIVNVVTRSGSTLSGRRVRASAGSWETGELVASWGASGVSVDDQGETTAWNVLAAGGYYTTEGEALDLPRFDVGDTGLYEAVDLQGSTIWGGPQSGTDFERAPFLFVHAQRGELTLLGRAGFRERGEPFAPYAALYGSEQQYIRDSKTFVELRWDRQLATGLSLQLRAFHDNYWYDERDPYADSFTYAASDPVERGYVFELDSSSRDTGGEVRLSWQRGTHYVTLGGEYRWRSITQGSFNRFFDGQRAPTGPGLPPLIDVTEPGRFGVVYLQEEWRPREWLSLIAGGNFADTSPGGSKAKARVAAILKPSRDVSIKALYGGGFRPPSLFEGSYRDFQNQVDNPALQSEEIESAELSLVWNPSDRLALQGYGFTSELSGLVQGVTIDSAGELQGGVGTRAEDPLDPDELAALGTVLQYQSTGDVRSHGAGASLRLRTPNWIGFLNAAWATGTLRAADGTESDLPANSSWLASAGLGWDGGTWSLGAMARYVGPQPVDPSFADHPLGAGDAGDFVELDLRARFRTFLVYPVSFQLDVHNALRSDGSYAASPVYVLPRLPIEGRRLVFGCEVRF
jgi:iron complex outermembrane receptor protein